jgi:selenocysteine lyase/cysteine desulfurase
VHAEEELQPSTMPNRFEAGTMNGLGIAGAGAGIKYIQDFGMDRIRDYENKLTESLIQGLSGIPGIVIYPSKDRTKQAPVLSFNLPDYEPGEVGAILDQAFDIKVRTGLHCAPVAHKTLGTYPKGTVRISPGLFNTVQEIEQTVEAIKKIAAAAKKG